MVADNYTAYSKEEPKPAAKPLAAKRTPSAEEEEDKKQDEEDSLVLTAEVDVELNNSKMDEEEEGGRKNGEGRVRKKKKLLSRGQDYYREDFFEKVRYRYKNLTFRIFSLAFLPNYPSFLQAVKVELEKKPCCLGVIIAQIFQKYKT